MAAITSIDKFFNLINNENVPMIDLESLLKVIAGDIVNYANYDPEICQRFLWKIYNILDLNVCKKPLISLCIDTIDTIIEAKSPVIRNMLMDVNFLYPYSKHMHKASSNQMKDDEFLKKLIDSATNIVRETDSSITISTISSGYSSQEIIFTNGLLDVIINCQSVEVVASANSHLWQLAKNNNHVLKAMQIPEILEKIYLSSNLMAFKWLIVIDNDVFNTLHEKLFKIVHKNLAEALETFDIEVVTHCVDILSYGNQLKINASKITPQTILDLNDLNNKMAAKFSRKLNDREIRFSLSITKYFSEFIKFFKGEVEHLKDIVLKCVKDPCTSESLELLSTFLRYDGSFELMKHVIDSKIKFAEVFSLNLATQIEIWKFLWTLEQKKMIKVHENSIIYLLRGRCAFYEKLSIDVVNENEIILFILFLKTLHMLNEPSLSERIRTIFNKIVGLKILPFLIAKGLMLRNNEFVELSLRLASIDKLLIKSIATILAQNEFDCCVNKHRQLKNEINPLATGASTIECVDETILKITKAIAKNNLKDCEIGDIIAVYQFKIEHLQNKLLPLSDALNSSSFYCMEMEKINKMSSSELRRMSLKIIDCQAENRILKDEKALNSDCESSLIKKCDENFKLNQELEDLKQVNDANERRINILNQNIMVAETKAEQQKKEIEKLKSVNYAKDEKIKEQDLKLKELEKWKSNVMSNKQEVI